MPRLTPATRRRCALVLAAFALMTTASSALAAPRYSDFDRRMREEQDAIRKRMEGGSHVSSFDTQPSHGTQTYGTPEHSQYTQPAYQQPLQRATPTSYAPAPVQIAVPEWVPPPIPSTPRLVPHKVAKPMKQSNAAKKAVPSSKKQTSKQTIAQPANIVPMKNLDTMSDRGAMFTATTGLGPIARAAVIGGFFGGLVGLVAWVISAVAGAISPTNKPQLQRILPLALFAGILPIVNNVTTKREFDTSKIPILNMLVTSEGAMANSGDKQFENVGSATFGCSITMPTPYTINRQDLLGMHVTTVNAEEKNGAFLMCYAKLPDALLHPGPNVLGQPQYFDVNRSLDGSAKGSVDAMKGKTTYQTALMLEGRYPGREIEGTIPEKKGLFRQRIYFADGNYYQTAVVGTAEVVNSRDAYKFLDSFKIK